MAITWLLFAILNIGIMKVVMFTLMSHKLAVTFHDYEKTWDEAQVTCKNSGGILYVEDSEERTNVLMSYKTLWQIQQHIWIGLHYPSIGQNGTFGWTDCKWQNTDWYSHYLPAEPKDASQKRCGLSDKTGGNWITDSCTAKYRFVCETKSFLDTCTFNKTNGVPTEGVVLNQLALANRSVAVCASECLQRIWQNTHNCWAFFFDHAAMGNNCILYFHNDPFYFSTVQTTANSNATFGVKQCYQLGEETHVSNVSIKDAAEVPTEVCSSYSLQVTTTQSSSSTTSQTTQALATTQTQTSTSPTTQTQMLTSPEAPSEMSSTTQTLTSTSPTTQTDTLTSSTAQIHTSTSPTAQSQTVTSVNVQTQTAMLPTTQTQTPTSRTTTPGMCMCQCSDIQKLIGNSANSFANLTIEEQVANIVRRLRLDKTTLTSTLRKKTSATDNRPVSKSIGYIGITFMSIVFGLIIFSDALKLWNYLRQFKTMPESNNVQTQLSQ
ncbi:uncharacterized protein LOC127841939 isoform X2 [Dreissena polymorpha]|uniref:uncharacterized protein LOC127841939 isoform X2 n=1 Tax=Dreissena polymorpha TaxID=45954 RepID=UPI002264A98E|nr:uncharacterized protein LOC127841939 isoform X2 [Dreissena polymorpha]